MLEAGSHAFLASCWTRAEQDYAAGSVPRLAARWAAKEATMKALGVGIGDIDPLHIEICSVEGQPPQLVLTGSAAVAAKQQGIQELSLSMTHETQYALAFVVAYSHTRMHPPATD